MSQVHLLAIVLDGKVSRAERRLWRECCEVAEGVAVHSTAALLYTAARFQRTGISLECSMLLGTFDPVRDCLCLVFPMFRG